MTQNKLLWHMAFGREINTLETLIISREFWELEGRTKKRGESAEEYSDRMRVAEREYETMKRRVIEQRANIVEWLIDHPYPKD